ncbi:hypothetical protein QTJ16_005449 [Diplocarpon rosae]|uniref:CFEM domain-containing protein n=1 Tax=Diplocarpon rosae TaxID=946125 RepID=A0AAD9WB78_9HELO|nr:hypothetical protein QTJ16_005449 [Diplocarpon rosae]
MKFSSTTVVAILASVAYAQSIAELTAQIPACGQTCLATAITGAGCDIADKACQCGSNMSAITKSATPCVIAGCSSTEALCVSPPSPFPPLRARQLPDTRSQRVAVTQSLTAKICEAVAEGSDSGSSVAGTASSTPSSTPSSASRSSTATPTLSRNTSAASSTSTAPPTTGAGSKKELAGIAVGAALMAVLL